MFRGFLADFAGGWRSFAEFRGRVAIIRGFLADFADGWRFPRQSHYSQNFSNFINSQTVSLFAKSSDGWRFLEDFADGWRLFAEFLGRVAMFRGFPANFADFVDFAARKVPGAGVETLGIPSKNSHTVSLLTISQTVSLLAEFH